MSDSSNELKRSIYLQFTTEADFINNIPRPISVGGEFYKIYSQYHSYLSRQRKMNREHNTPELAYKHCRETFLGITSPILGHTRGLGIESALLSDSIAEPISVADEHKYNDSIPNKKHKLDTPDELRRQIESLLSSTKAVIHSSQMLLEEADEKYRIMHMKFSTRVIDLQHDLTQARDQLWAHKNESESILLSLQREQDELNTNTQNELTRARADAFVEFRRNQATTNDLTIAVHRSEGRLRALQSVMEEKVAGLQIKLSEKSNKLELLTQSSIEVEKLYEHHVDQVLAFQRMDDRDATTRAKLGEMKQWTQKLTNKLTEDASAEDRLQCVICCDRERAVLFRPCTHLVACKECSRGSPSAPMRHCPICRSAITARFMVTL